MQVEVVELTKRQRGLVNGGCEFLGQKIKPPEDPSSKNWCAIMVPKLRARVPDIHSFDGMQHSEAWRSSPFSGASRLAKE